MRDGKTYDAQHPYANRDYRFYANITYDGSTYNKHKFEIHYAVDKGKEVPGADLTKYGTSRNAAVTRTGYYCVSFLTPKQSFSVIANMAANSIISFGDTLRRCSIMLRLNSVWAMLPRLWRLLTRLDIEYTWTLCPPLRLSRYFMSVVWS